MFVIAAVTAAMIAILSAFNGIESVVTELFGTLDAPVAVVPTEGSVVPNGAGTWVMDRFGPESTNPVVQCAAAVIEDEAVVAVPNEPVARGVPLEEEVFNPFPAAPTVCEPKRW